MYSYMITTYYLLIGNSLINNTIIMFFLRVHILVILLTYKNNLHNSVTCKRTNKNKQTQKHKKHKNHTKKQNKQTNK